MVHAVRVKYDGDSRKMHELASSVETFNQNENAIVQSFSSLKNFIGHQ
jgi:hypothetical protein